MATVANTETRIIFKISIFLLISFESRFLNLKKWYTKIPCAIISKIINNNNTTLLKSLYIWISNLIPKKMECIAKKIADKMPNVLNYS